MNQYNNPSVQQNDILSVSVPAAAPEAEGNRNIWKTRTSAKQLKYAAIVRQLPRGIEGLRNGSYPSVKIMTHYLKDAVSGADVKIQCCKTDPKAKRCPVCEALWNRYNAIKAAEGEEKAKSYCRRWWAQTEWMTNVLIRRDQNNAANNGQVKVWAHSDAVERKLYDPCVQSAPAINNDPNAIQEQSKRCFIPYSPRDGVDYVVIAQYDTSKNMPNYDACYWQPQATPLANTDEEMLAILDQCHDLDEFVRAIPSEEAASAAVTEFFAKVDAARRGAAGFQTAAGAAPAPTPAPAYNAPNYQQYAQFVSAPAPAQQNVFTQQPAAPAPQAVDPNAYFAQQPAAPAAPVAPAPQQNMFAQQTAAPAPQAMDPNAYFAQQPAAPVAPAAPAPAPAPVAPADPFAVGGTALPGSDDDDDDLPF